VCVCVCVWVRVCVCQGTDLYDKVVASLNAQATGGSQQCSLAWAYVHRFNVCTVKNQFGLYNLETLNSCMSDLKKGLQALSKLCVVACVRLCVCLCVSVCSKQFLFPMHCGTINS
jgi:hypothetical protein